MTEIIEKPFDWNDNLSEIAQEDFSLIQKSLPYCTCQTIGMALAKLKLLENGRASWTEWRTCYEQTDICWRRYVRATMQDLQVVCQAQ